MKKFLLRYNSNNFIWFVIWANRISICARWSVASMTGWGEQVDTSSGADRHLRLVFRNSSAMHLSWFITDEKSLTCKTSNFCPFCWFFFWVDVLLHGLTPKKDLRLVLTHSYRLQRPHIETPSPRLRKSTFVEWRQIRECDERAFKQYWFQVTRASRDYCFPAEVTWVKARKSMLWVSSYAIR